MSPPAKPLTFRLAAFFRKRFPAIFGRARQTGAQPPPPNANTDFPLDALPGVEGRLGKLNATEFAGWAFRPERPSEHLHLALYDGERLVCTAVADQPRPKLVNKKGDGKCGFNAPIPESFRDGKPHALDIRLAGTSQSLLRKPIRVVLPKRTPQAVAGPAAEGPVAPSRPLELALPAARAIAVAPSGSRLATRRERAQHGAAAGPDLSAGTLFLIDPRGETRLAAESLTHWQLQSHPHIDAVQIANDAATDSQTEILQADDTDSIAAALAAANWCVFARSGDLLHPSTTTALNRQPAAVGVVLWSLFEPAPAGGGTLFIRGPCDPHTLRHNPSIDTTFAVRGELLASCPKAIVAALAAGRIHPLLFWLTSRPEIGWHRHLAGLTTRPSGAACFHARADLAKDEGLYQTLAQDLSGAFDLRATRSDLPVPFILLPRRRAGKISMIVADFADSATILRCLNAFTLQRITGGMEVVLALPPETARPIADKARQMFGTDCILVVEALPSSSDSARINQAIAAATGEVAILCRSDVVLEDDAIAEEMAAWALVPGIATVGCTLRPRSGEAIHGAAGAAPALDPDAPILVGDTDETYAKNIRACAGNMRALMAMETRTLAALGGFDEVWCPTGQNVVELGLRAARAGLTHLCLGHLSARCDTPPMIEDSLEIARLRETYPEAQQAAAKHLRAVRIGSPAAGGSAAIDPLEERRKPVLLTLFDLGEDLDVLLPVLLALRAQDRFSLRSCVTDWPGTESARTIALLQEHGFSPEIVTRNAARHGAAATLAGVDALLTASETNQSAHATAHALAKRADAAGIATFTLQHGFENIGLTYSDQRFDGAVRFASQTIFVWFPAERLPDWVSQDTRRRIVAVGRPKTVPAADRQLPDVGEWQRKIGVFENLHWHRYGEPYKRDFFMHLAGAADFFADTLFLVKPHGSGRWSIDHPDALSARTNIRVIEPRDTAWEKFTAPSLLPHLDAAITTPSTVAVDAARAAKPVAVVGNGLDLPLYEPLPILAAPADWRAFLESLDRPETALSRNETFLRRHILTGASETRVADHIWATVKAKSA